ncbi:MAG TPA: DUF2079 domain-containing protein [Streptosporangiaceae bacterium]|nr:DUF2079 domain-containing protein [Streptosporangiaceae bacterium]
MTVLRPAATSAADLRQAWMPQQPGTSPDVGTADVTSVPEPGGERLGTLPVETSPAVAPVGTTLTMPPVETVPEPPRTAGQPGTGGAGTTRPDPVAWLIALATFAAYTTLSVARYRRLNPGSWDLGIYTQYVRQLAHLHAPVVAIRGPGFNLLGDHFQPMVALVAPFFRLFPTPVTLLVAQALLTAVSVVPVCRAAQARLGTGVSRVIGAAYGFSWGLQQMIIFDFHEIAFAVPLLACSLSALVRRRPRAAAAWALPLVFVKEDQGLTVAAIGLVMIAQAAGPWMRQRRERAADGGKARAGAWAGADGDEARAGAWAGAVLVLWGLGWSALAIAVIIPHFNPAHHYAYWSDGGVISPAGGHISAGGLLAQLTNAGPVKLRTTVLVLLPVAFLALRSPLAAIAVPGLALRFLSTNSSFWGTRWHYSAVLMPIVFVAAVDGLARIQARASRCQAPAGNASRRAYPPWRKPWAARQKAPAAPGRDRAAGTGPPGARAARYAAVAMAAIAALLAFRFPLAGLWSPRTYQVTPHVRAEREAFALIPAGTTVESTLTMLAPLAARDSATWIGTGGNPVPRYVAYDAGNSGYAHPPADVAAFINSRYPGVTYQTIFKADGVYLFRRTGNG